MIKRQNEKDIVCQPGFEKVGRYCYDKCPQGMKTQNAVCQKRFYSRGLGYALWDYKICEKKNPQGCERFGIFYYAKCGANYTNIGCCMCYEKCPDDMKQIDLKVCKRKMQTDSL